MIPAIIFTLILAAMAMSGAIRQEPQPKDEGDYEI